jgi:hypothetical protein
MSRLTWAEIEDLERERDSLRAAKVGLLLRVEALERRIVDIEDELPNEEDELRRDYYAGWL